MKLPGVGKKSALRYAYHVSLVDPFSGSNLAHSIEDAIKFIKRCSKCRSLSQNEICDVCADSERDREMLCLVESPKDVLIIEKSGTFDGLYFVLDDIDGDIIDKLKINILENETKEIIFALTPGINSDGIMLYIEDKLKEMDVKFTKIAQGIPTGVTLDNIDMLSLTKALDNRMKI
ncbi:MAG: recombination protein RecR [Campylobacteraceae bacterium]|nr:recombination protein RecR [Campylobacteraceae bacterium]